MDLNLFLNVLIIAGIVGLGFFLKNYLPNYFSEKGKNLATKEDISEITEKIESVKNSFALSQEKVKAELQVKSALQQAFQSKCLEALIAINELLVEIHLYCWKQIATRSPAEHYVWCAVDNSTEGKGLHYFTVAIDKIAMEHSLYLTSSSNAALSSLSVKIGNISNLEMHLDKSEQDSIFEKSAVSNYQSAIMALQECRRALKKDLFFENENYQTY